MKGDTFDVTYQGRRHGLKFGTDIRQFGTDRPPFWEGAFGNFGNCGIDTFRAGGDTPGAYLQVGMSVVVVVFRPELSCVDWQWQSCVDWQW